MYLSNQELAGLVEGLFPPRKQLDPCFNAEKQLNVCSIDVRLGHVFWVMKKRGRAIDLGEGGVNEISPHFLWKKVVLGESDVLTLKPGDMVLGRVHEYISMPPQYVGKINTRSSYARLGISTACNCDLVNPGYSGHVPLELVNNTKNSYKLRPYLPLAQIFVMDMGAETSSAYGEEQFSNLYQDDDGGPSRWWRDVKVKEIASAFPEQDKKKALIQKVQDNVDKIDDYGVERLFHFSRKASKYDNIPEFLEGFQQSESQKDTFRTIVISMFGFLASLAAYPVYELGVDLYHDDPTSNIGKVSLAVLLVSLFPLTVAMHSKLIRKVKYYTDIL